MYHSPFNRARYSPKHYRLGLGYNILLIFFSNCIISHHEPTIDINKKTTRNNTKQRKLVDFAEAYSRSESFQSEKLETLHSVCP